MPISGKAGSTLLAVCLLFCFATTARASSFIMPADEDLIIGARAIVQGKVISITCQLDEPSGRVFTYVRLRVREALKGQIEQQEIILKEEGGEARGRGSTVPGTPDFEKGEKVLLYLDTWSDGSLRVHQMFLGKFRIVDDAQTGQSFVVRDIPDWETAVPGTAHDAQAHRSFTNQAELTAYTAMVRKNLADNWERSVEFEQTHYQNLPILTQPREWNPSAGEVRPQFVFIFNPPARWFEPDSGQPVVFQVNPENAPSAGIMDDVAAAMNAWSTVAGCTMRVANGGATANCASGQSTIIQFNNCDDRWAPGAGCSGVLALGGISWDTSSRKQVNGTTFVKTIAGFVSFNPYASCSFGDHCNVREVATHELGHALGLGHTVETTATMYATAHFDGRCASLKPDDIDGITYMYPAVDGGIRPLMINTESFPAGIVRAAYTTTVLNGTGGARPYIWSVVAGQGRIPNGLQFNSGGLIGGVPLDTGTFAFTVQLADANGTSVRKTYSITVIEPTGPYDSQFISQTVPATVLPNQPFSVNIKFLNLGSQSWDSASGLTLRSQNPVGNITWGGATVQLGGIIITPGKLLDVTFTAVSPRNFGTYDFQWQLYQDSTGLFGQMSANVSLRVTDGSSPPAITSPSSIDAVAGAAFSYQLAVSAGSAPFTWSLASGALPPGLALSSNAGIISGTPAAAGSSTVTVQVTDAQNRSAQKAITMNVTPPVLTVATASISQAQKGSPFVFQLSATGGKPPYTWTVTAGALPAGLNLASATGIISGTPGATGSFGVTFTATDSESHTASRAFSVTVVPPPLSIANVSQLEAVKGSACNYQLTASGGTLPYTWSVTFGALPAGLNLNSAAGSISGVPTVAGLFTLSVTVRDQASTAATASVQIRVLDPETIPSIRKVKYKGHKKLIVNGDRFNAAAVLLVDGVQLSAAPDDGQFFVKPIALAAGRHEIKVMNPGAIFSQTVVIDVE